MGDEFDQYKRQSGADTADDQDEFAQFKRKQQTHATSPSFFANDETRAAAAHTQPGTSTTEEAAHPQMDPFAPLISGRNFLNTIAHPVQSFKDVRARGTKNVSGSIVPDINFSPETDTYGHLKTKALEREAQGKPRGLPGMATDAVDLGASFTSPPNLALMGAGGLTSVAPEFGVITKPLFAAAGTGFGIAGAHDIYQGATDPTLDTPERARKILMGGSQVAGGAAGVGETSLRGAFNRGMDIRPPNEPFSPREILDTATQHDINLDLADATGNRGVPKLVKHSTMHGLAGSGPFEANLEHNVGALDRWGHDFLDQLSPRSGEASGARIQEALKRDYEVKKGGASQEFEDLDRRVGPNTVDGTATVEAEARRLRGSMQSYYDKHPELVPKKAWAILENLAERPTGPNNRPLVAHNFSWSELHQLRSDLMDIYRNSPELIKSREQAWLQQMVKVIDDTMTGAAANLSAADRQQFRHANEEWEGLKSTYDNPQHPLYHAIRSQMPTQVAGSLLNTKAPEFVRQLRGILGPEFGDLQRAAAENILGQDPGGAGYAFKTMPGRLSKLRPDYVADLFGPAGDDLRKMAKIGSTVTRDINPSGSGKILQKVGETSAIGTGIGFALAGHPLPLAIEGGGLLAARGASKAMNSPRITRFLTSPERAPALPRGLMIAGPANSDEEFMQHGRDFIHELQRKRRFEMAGQ